MGFNRRRLALLALSVLGALSLFAGGCSKGSPVAPGGTILIVSASPSQIAVNGSSSITIIGRRPDGNALAAGTEIFLSSTIGRIAPMVQIGSNGTAITTLRGDGRSGKATVNAQTSDGIAKATVDVQVGADDTNKPTLLVSANPNVIFVGATSQITVIVRNHDGSLAGAGLQVILTTTLGSLSPARPTTNANGVATSTLTAGSQSGTATVTAIVGNSDAVPTTVTINQTASAISVQSNPSSVPRGGGTLTLTAFVINAQGQAISGASVTFQSERGTLNPNGVVFTNTTGVATTMLTLTQDQLAGVTSFVVTASTPTGTGELLTASITIVVQ